MIMNKTTGLFYIGSSIDIASRLTEHLCRLRNNVHSNAHLQNAFIKYGEKDFNISILELADKEILTQREQAWLDFTEVYKRDIGYNIAPMADRSEHSEETKQKISAMTKGRIVTKEENRKRSISLKQYYAKHGGNMTGKRHKPESIAKMCVAQKGRIITPEAKHKMSEAHKGKKLSSEHKKQIRLSVINTKYRQKIEMEKKAGQLYFEELEPELPVKN